MKKQLPVIDGIRPVIADVDLFLREGRSDSRAGLVERRRERARKVRLVDRVEQRRQAVLVELLVSSSTSG